MKTPPAPVPPSSATVPPRTSDSRTLAALCAAGLATACSSVPIRPTQKACPPQAMAAMQQRNWDSVNLFVDPNTVPYTRHTGDQIPMRPGPVIHGIWEDEGFRTDPGLAGLLHGYAFYAEDGRIVLRYTEVELPSGERVPVCFAVKNDEGTYDVRRREPDGTVYNIQTGWKVRVFPD